MNGQQAYTSNVNVLLTLQTGSLTVREVILCLYVNATTWKIQT